MASEKQNKEMIQGISLDDNISAIQMAFSQVIGHIPSYPFRMEENNPNRQLVEREVRTSTMKKWKDSAKSKAAKESMSIDCAKLWNIAPSEVTNAATKTVAKKEIKKFARTLEM